MYHIKKDKRQQESAMCLMKGLTECLQTKKMSDISVSELCSNSSVSRTGLTVMGSDYSTIELAFEGGKTCLRRVTCLKADGRASETIDEDITLEDSAFQTVYFKLKIARNGSCTFFYSLDGKKYKALGDSFQMREGRWTGAKAGFFATAKIKSNDSGSVDIY